MTTAANVSVEQARTLVPATSSGTATTVSVKQARALVPAIVTATVSVKQARMLVVAKGRVENHRLRAWTFSQDGHDFYVLRLGEDSTVVYDITTQSWSKWESPGLGYLRAHRGMNWLGMATNTLQLNATTNVVVGDDRTSYLFTLNPYAGYDEDTDLSQNAFTRKVLGGVPMRTRKTQPVGAAYLSCSMGTPQITGATFTLRTSDDYGKTWTDHGSVVSNTADYTQEFSWRSLGLIRAPGKAFEISDNGASVRIDTLEIR